MQKQRYIALWLRLLSIKEFRATRRAKALLVAQSKDCASLFQTHGPHAVESYLRQQQTDWARLLKTEFSETARAFGNFVADQLEEHRPIKNIKIRLKSFLPKVLNFVAQNAFDKSNFITGTSITIARRVLSHGIENGLTTNEIAGNLQEALGGAMGTLRARMIARTEIHNAATFGMQAEAEDMHQDVPLERVWISVHDTRTRGNRSTDEFDHVSADGQTRGMDEPFVIAKLDGGSEAVDRPGEGSPGNSINCRCAVKYQPLDFSF